MILGFSYGVWGKTKGRDPLGFLTETSGGDYPRFFLVFGKDAPTQGVELCAVGRVSSISAGDPGAGALEETLLLQEWEGLNQEPAVVWAAVNGGRGR